MLVLTAVKGGANCENEDLSRLATFYIWRLEVVSKPTQWEILRTLHGVWSTDHKVRPANTE